MLIPETSLGDYPSFFGLKKLYNVEPLYLTMWENKQNVFLKLKMELFHEKLYEMEP